MCEMSVLTHITRFGRLVSNLEYIYVCIVVFLTHHKSKVIEMDSIILNFDLLTFQR